MGKNYIPGHLRQNVRVKIKHIVPHDHAALEFADYDLAAFENKIFIHAGFFVESHAACGTLFAIRQIPALIAADVEIFTRHKFCQFSKISVDKLVNFGVGYTKIPTLCPPETGPVFQQFRHFRVAGQAVDKGQIGRGNNFKTALESVIDNLPELVGGIGIFLVRVGVGFELDPPCYIKQKRVVAVFCQKVNIKTDKLHGFFLAVQVDLRRPDLIILHNKQSLHLSLFVTRYSRRIKNQTLFC